MRPNLPRHSGGNLNINNKSKSRRKCGVHKTVDEFRASIPRPFSMMTEFENTPLFDIESYVNRSTETRLVEVELHPKAPGRIPRPLNGFLLYRKCYVGRAHAYVASKGRSGSQQSFSTVLGVSWHIEPQEIRDKFKKWSETEREKHRKAFPDYKYAPAQPPKVRKKPEVQLDDDWWPEDWFAGAPLSGYELGSAPPPICAGRHGMEMQGDEVWEDEYCGRGEDKSFVAPLSGYEGELAQPPSYTGSRRGRKMQRDKVRDDEYWGRETKSSVASVRGYEMGLAPPLEHSGHRGMEYIPTSYGTWQPDQMPARGVEESDFYPGWDLPPQAHQRYPQHQTYPELQTYPGPQRYPRHQTYPQHQAYPEPERYLQLQTYPEPQRYPQLPPPLPCPYDYKVAADIPLEAPTPPTNNAPTWNLSIDATSSGATGPAPASRTTTNKDQIVNEDADFPFLKKESSPEWSTGLDPLLMGDVGFLNFADCQL